MSAATTAGGHPSRTIAEYLTTLASSAPVPGGGSAAALAGAMAAALVSMVANLTVGQAKYAAVGPPMREVLATAEAARTQLIALMEEDERAYTAFATALKLPRGTDVEKRARSRATQQALHRAATPPLAMARVCRQVLDLVGTAAELGNPYLASDAGVAALLAEAALRASAINVRVNLVQIKDEPFVAETEAALTQLLDGVPALKEAIVAVANRRLAGG